MHNYAADSQSGARNCNCGASQHHRVHWHDFTPSWESPVRCVCGLSAGADCHGGQLRRDLVTVVKNEIAAAQPKPVEARQAYSTVALSQCGHSNHEMAEDHLCLCTRSAFHPLNVDQPHRCWCERSWPDKAPAVWIRAAHVVDDSVISVVEEEVPEPEPAYPDSVLKQCGHSGGLSVSGEHICVCNRSAFHPMDDQHPHACDCGQSWRDQPSFFRRVAEHRSVSPASAIITRDPLRVYSETMCHRVGEIRSSHTCSCSLPGFHTQSHVCECGKQWTDQMEFYREVFEHRSVSPAPAALHRDPNWAYPESVTITCHRSGNIHGGHVCSCDLPGFHAEAHACSCGRSWDDHMEFHRVVVEPRSVSPAPAELHRDPNWAYPKTTLCYRSGGVHEDHVCSCELPGFHDDHPHHCRCGRSWEDESLFNRRFIVTPAEARSVAPAPAVIYPEPKHAYPEDLSVCKRSGGIAGDHICVCNQPAFHPVDADRPHTCNCGEQWVDQPQFRQRTPENRSVSPAPAFIGPETPLAYPESSACKRSGGINGDHMCACSLPAYHETDDDHPHTCNCGQQWTDRPEFRQPATEPRSVAPAPAEFPLPPREQAYPSVASACGHTGGIDEEAGHVCFCDLPAFHPVGGEKPHRCQCGSEWADVHHGFSGDIPRVVLDA